MNFVSILSLILWEDTYKRRNKEWFIDWFQFKDWPIESILSSRWWRWQVAAPNLSPLCPALLCSLRVDRRTLCMHRIALHCIWSSKSRCRATWLHCCHILASILASEVGILLSECALRDALKKKTTLFGNFSQHGGGVFPNPKTFVNLPSIFLYAKFILRC